MINLDNYIEKTVHKAELNKSEVLNNPAYDIIVPVYNGFDALKKCAESLLKHTDSKHNIIFHNDASTDNHIKSWLDNLADTHAHISAVHNASNLGYLSNVNCAIQATSNNIILLNADTRLTKKWLEELNIIANEQSVGIVCPLSDNATILTLDNNLTNKISLLDHFSGKWYPIPTAVGSCMLIKRSIINEFGVFDEYYQPGYGEECDYSMRLRSAGYDIACAPASFVFHSGSASFLENASLLKQQHQKLLDLRWPEYSKSVQDFLENNPLRSIEEYLYNTESNGSILHVVHGLENTGGIELFTHELLLSLTEDAHTVLIPSHKKISGKTAETTHLADNIRVTNYQFNNRKNQTKIANRNADLFQQELDIQFVRQLIYGKHNIVHFHSLVGLGSLIWPLICQKLGINYVISCHDHYSICTNFSLLTNNYTHYCEKTNCYASDPHCVGCLKSLTLYSNTSTEEYIELRNKIWYQIIKHSIKVIVPNQYLENVFISKYGHMIQPKLLKIEPYFFPDKLPLLKQKSLKQTRLEQKSNELIKIAFLGTFSFEKGAQLFLDAYNSLSTKNIEWHIIGKIHPIYRHKLKNLKINCSGTYDRKNLTQLLSPIDLIVLPSLHPESYAITLTEAWLHHIPVICSNIGAFKQRINVGNNGLLFSSGDAKSLQKTIQSTIDNPILLTKMQDFIAVSNSQSKPSDKQEILKIYSQFSETSININNNRFKYINHLPKPCTNAYQIMDKWLYSELTLEAESDWKSDKNTDIIIIGNNQNSIKISQQSCLTYAPNSRILSIDKLPSNLSSVICILQAGQTLNDNFGNWTEAFKNTNKVIGLADYALIDKHQQPYAPQFLASFDVLNYLNCKHRIAAYLISKEAIININKSLYAIDIIDNLINENKTDEIHYFPHLSYLYNDVLWAKQWKKGLQKNTLSGNKSKRESTSVFLLSNDEKPKVDIIIDALQLQKNIIIKHIYVFTPSLITFDFDGIMTCHCVDFDQVDVFINPVVERDNSEALLFINDNIEFDGSFVLHQLSDCLNHYNIQAVSPAFCDDKDSIFSEKLGNGHISGRGIINDVRFKDKSIPLATQLLDEDCFLIKKSAWQLVKGFSRVGNIYYRVNMLSQMLHKNKNICALQSILGLYKKGLPSHLKANKNNCLESQRQELFQQNKEFYLNAHHYSKSYNSLESIKLDQFFGTFKTPKTLPRVLAYANDTWASGFYRVKAPLSALTANNQISCHFLPEKRQNRTANYFEINKQQANVLLLHNFLSDNQISALKQYRKYLDIPLILSMDDLLTDIPDYNPFASSNPQNIERNIHQALECVDRLIVSSDYLANKFSHLHSDIIVVKNTLPKELWQHDFEINPAHSKIRIGWAGAGQHSEDLNWLISVIMATKEDVQWVFYGDKPDSIDGHFIEFHPHTSLSEYHSKLRSLNLDIAIAPLAINNFNRAKSNLRLLEYGALGIATICSNIDSYSQTPAIKLDNSPQLWIENIVELAHNSKSRNKLSLEMYEWVNKSYMLEDYLSIWAKALMLK